MLGLSAFAFVFAGLMIVWCIYVCFKEKRDKAFTVFSCVITVGILALVGVLTVDSLHGARSVETSITMDHINRPSKYNLIVRFPDREGNRYWGVGNISDAHYSTGQEVPVRITYLPQTKYVLRIERYVTNSLNISIPPLFGYDDTPYIEMYSDDTAWGISCLAVLGGMIYWIIITQRRQSKKQKKREI